MFSTHTALSWCYWFWFCVRISVAFIDFKFNCVEKWHGVRSKRSFIATVCVRDCHGNRYQCSDLYICQVPANISVSLVNTLFTHISICTQKHWQGWIATFIHNLNCRHAMQCKFSSVFLCKKAFPLWLSIFQVLIQSCNAEEKWAILLKFTILSTTKACTAKNFVWSLQNKQYLEMMENIRASSHINCDIDLQTLNKVSATN